MQKKALLSEGVLSAMKKNRSCLTEEKNMKDILYIKEKIFFFGQTVLRRFAQKKQQAYCLQSSS